MRLTISLVSDEEGKKKERKKVLGIVQEELLEEMRIRQKILKPEIFKTMKKTTKV
jgi:hypothetical protein